jgi:predicted nucleic acid-binding protein
VSAVLVDTNVLVDVLRGDERWGRWSAEHLAAAADGAAIVINPIVYTELSMGFATIEQLDAALSPLEIEREPLPYPAGFLAGRAFLEYRRRGGSRTSPLPDYYIGAHAAVAGYRLLTRDARRYRASFPRLQIIAPE